MYTQKEVDDLLEAERQRTEERMDERFNAAMQRMDERFNAAMQGMEERFNAAMQGMEERFNSDMQRMEERFNAERDFLNRLIDMHKHKNDQYQGIITTMSAEIIKKNTQIGQANGEIVALRQVVGMLLGTAAGPPMSCAMQASKTMRLF
jgi:cell division septum initiation protein DivIVA